MHRSLDTKDTIWSYSHINDTAHCNGISERVLAGEELIWKEWKRTHKMGIMDGKENWTVLLVSTQNASLVGRRINICVCFREEVEDERGDG